MTDTGAYTDVVFGLFWLLCYRFSPRIADIGGARYWRMDPSAAKASRPSLESMERRCTSPVERFRHHPMLHWVRSTALLRKSRRLEEKESRSLAIILTTTRFVHCSRG